MEKFGIVAVVVYHLLYIDYLLVLLEAGVPVKGVHAKILS